MARGGCFEDEIGVREWATQIGVTTMKMLVSTLSLALILAFNISAFAGVVTMAQNQADCENTSGTWDARAKLCSEKRSNQCLSCPLWLKR
jgi:hypothetical protein